MSNVSLTEISEALAGSNDGAVLAGWAATRLPDLSSVPADADGKAKAILNLWHETRHSMPALNREVIEDVLNALNGIQISPVAIEWIGDFLAGEVRENSGAHESVNALHQLSADEGLAILVSALFWWENHKIRNDRAINGSLPGAERTIPLEFERFFRIE